MHGKWDYALFLGVKTIAEFHQIWDDIMRAYKERIKSYNIAVYAPIHNFNRKFLLTEAHDAVQRVYGAGEPESIDEVDQRIIRAYANDVRQSAVALAKTVGLSSQAVRTRIKGLERKNIIVGYKIGLNLEPLGYAGYRVDLQLAATTRNAELFEFCRRHPNIYQVNRSIGGADFEIECIVRDLQHLLTVIDELKTRFSDVVNDAEYFGFSTFHVLQYIPD
jgi:DNA-binding Lrp family transcriptional regulator